MFADVPAAAPSKAKPDDAIEVKAGEIWARGKLVGRVRRELRIFKNGTPDTCDVEMLAPYACSRVPATQAAVKKWVAARLRIA